MNNLLKQVIRNKGKKIDESVIKEELYEICERVHASCCDECPVFEFNNHSVLDTAHDFDVNRGCDCFKDGEKMLAFIKTKSAVYK